MEFVGDDSSTTGAQVDAPDTVVTGAELATLDRSDGAVAETSQFPAFGDPHQRTETSGPQDDLPKRRDGASRKLSVKFRGASPLCSREGADAKSDGEDGAMEDKDDTPVHREGEQTQEDLRRNPKRTKKMKLDKIGDQQHEQSRSLTQKASGKSVKA